MKFEDSSLTTYLVKNLQPLTEADPVILAEYVAALLKKDRPIKELEKLCAEKLLEFLGQGTQSFIMKLFQALEDGSFVAPARSSDAIQQLEPSASRIREDPLETELKRSAMNTEEFSPSGCPTDQEEKEVTDDDDDDRNHKHRRRDNRSHSSDKDVQGQQLRRPSRKRNRPFENGHTFLANDPQPSENRKEYNPSFLEQRKRPGLGPSLRPYDMGLRTRTNQAFRGDPGSHFDMSTLGRIPTGRGRGRGSIPWSQSDSKFSSADMYEFSSQMAPQGPTLFAGRGMQSLGLIPGMPSGGLDALHPLGLQASMNQPFNIAIPRQRCRDFEERGFCLRGDMCPMEHGVNRIVVEDVQSLSQFNLPVSLSSAHLLGTPAGSGTLSLTSGPSSLMTNNKILHAKSSKPGATDDGLGLNRELSTSAASGEADLYDPDQPLWNNDHPETSSALMGLSSPQVDDAEPLWNADPSGHHSFRLSDGVESEHPGRSIASTVGSQSITSSVWERIGNPRNRLDMTAKIDSNATNMGNNENETKEQDESLSTIPGTTHQRKQIVSEDGGDKALSSAAVPRLRIQPARNSGRTSQKALRTLFVNCIPQKNNKKEALFSHFRRFGKVIDIYIPQNSERAFVQYSKSEEAEAALKAPDAVMGNRFIKLWWANRDSIPDNSIRTGDTSSAAPSVSASVPAQASTGSGGKENLSAILLKVTAAPSSEIPVLTAQPRPVVMNGPKVTPPSQKKLENLELLKEELRLKQELLDQKRNDFRRQLDKLEKQAITVKGEVIAAHTVKRQIPGTPKPMNPVTAGHRTGAEKTLDKTHSGENVESPSSKTNSTVVLQPPMSLKHQTRPSVQLGVPFVANRFKLDNRPSTFRILPLPADLANVGVLREHFSVFGDLSVVELEDSEANEGTKSSKPQKSASARVTFTTRGSAEKAFLNGKNWQGHSLKFTWLTGCNSSSSDHSGRESFPTPSLRSPPDAEVLAETVTFGSSSDMVKSTCINSEAAASTGNTEPKNPEARMVDVEHMDVPITCQSSETNSLSCETSTTKTEALLVEDGPHVEIKH